MFNRNSDRIKTKNKLAAVQRKTLVIQQRLSLETPTKQLKGIFILLCAKEIISG